MGTGTGRRLSRCATTRGGMTRTCGHVSVGFCLCVWVYAYGWVGVACQMGGFRENAPGIGLGS